MASKVNELHLERTLLMLAVPYNRYAQSVVKIANEAIPALQETSFDIVCALGDKKLSSKQCSKAIKHCIATLYREGKKFDTKIESASLDCQDEIETLERFSDLIDVPSLSEWWSVPYTCSITSQSQILAKNFCDEKRLLMAILHDSLGKDVYACFVDLLTSIYKERDSLLNEVKSWAKVNMNLPSRLFLRKMREFLAFDTLQRIQNIDRSAIHFGDALYNKERREIMWEKALAYISKDTVLDFETRRYRKDALDNDFFIEDAHSMDIESF